ncbi:hypothetical protein LTR17_021296 [Elasticomyces elasticus]|nr:hypothetical protein LTR17_021296 [Elasticomyces elasticus]
MSTSSKTWPVTQYHPRHGSWPYSPSDFDRQDPSSDSGFYSTPRFVTHIDDAAIATLREYYDTVLPRNGRILDFCSSWVSHYPSAVEQAAASGELKVTGMGMNKAELDANKVLNNGRVLADLNDSPEVAAALRNAKLISDDSEYLDASTNVVSTDYLTQPVEVLKSLRSVTKNGGKCSEDERLQMIGDYLHFAGWKEIEIVELSNGKVADGGAEGQQAGNLQSLMGWMGMNHRDPLWVVRATKT